MLLNEIVTTFCESDLSLLWLQVTVTILLSAIVFRFLFPFRSRSFRIGPSADLRPRDNEPFKSDKTTK